MWEDANYCWVVICKSRWLHYRQSLFAGHRIPLALTDAVAPRPNLPVRFRVTCDDCGRPHFYKPRNVLRYEMEVPENFQPHHAFR